MDPRRGDSVSRRVAMLVSNACAPDRRVLREGQALAAQGHHVLVIAWDREGRHPTQETISCMQPADTFAGQTVQIERIGVASAYGTGLRRVGQWPAFARRASARLRQDDWDAVHCHDLDTLPIGYDYTRRRSVPLVFDAHESYPDFVAPRLPGGAVVGPNITGAGSGGWWWSEIARRNRTQPYRDLATRRSRQPLRLCVLPGGSMASTIRTTSRSREASAGSGMSGWWCAMSAGLPAAG
jgi:hypothetical protein